MIEKRDIYYIKSRLKIPWNEYIKIYTPIENKKVLDAGCGWGWLYKLVKENGGKYFGIDPNEEKIEISKKLWKSTNFKKGYSENIPFPDAFFDIVISIDAVEHYKNLKDSFSEFYRVLKKGGFLFIFGPNFFYMGNEDTCLKEKLKFLYFRIKKKKTYIERPGVVSFLLISLLRKVGFKRVEVIPPLRWKTHFFKKFLHLVDLIRPTIKIMAQK